jgi:hypothetical protein
VACTKGTLKRVSKKKKSLRVERASWAVGPTDCSSWTASRALYALQVQMFIHVMQLLMDWSAVDPKPPSILTLLEAVPCLSQQAAEGPAIVAIYAASVSAMPADSPR